MDVAYHVTDLETKMRVHYSITAKIEGVPDIDQSSIWSGQAEKIMRPTFIQVDYQYSNNKWEQKPTIIVYGRRVRKDGTLGADMQISLSWQLNKAPPWVHGFIKDNPLPRMNIS